MAKSLVLDLSSKTIFPVRLVVITRLDGTIIRIAEAEEIIIVSGDSYVPLEGCTIKAVRNALGGDIPSVQIDFAHSTGGTFDTDEVAAGLFDGADINLWVADRDNLAAGKGAVPFFVGTVQTVTLNNMFAGSFDCKGAAVEAEVFVQTYQPMCRTDLFSDLCGLDPDNFDFHATIDTIIDRFNATITAPAEGAPVDGFLNQGTGEAASGFTFEIANWVQSSLQITTYLPRCALFTVGEAVTLWPGCNKLHRTCVDKFNNAINFQGEPHFLGAAATNPGG